MSGSDNPNPGTADRTPRRPGACLGAQAPVIRGLVVAGAHRGKQLGFPTANLQIPPSELPESGIYAVWVRIHGCTGWRPGAASVGINPTFEARHRQLEVHILGYSGPELYGKLLEILPAAYLRPEERYESAEALARQIRKDCEQARRVLARCPGPPDTAVY